MSLLLVLSLAACSQAQSLSGGELENTDPTISTDFDPNGTSSDPEPPVQIEYALNPLTGLKTLTEEEVGFKPVAVAVNNLKAAQKIQSGIGKADVVFETEVEGGITRLLAIYKAPTESIPHIGSVRSARVVFAELASSMNSVLIHHGMDEVYCRPVLNSLGTSRIEISEKAYGERLTNGLAWEHTLYTSGVLLRSVITSKGYTSGGSTEPWLAFSEERTVPAGGTAKNITVKFNGASSTNFFYNEETGNYSRGVGGQRLKDYYTGEEETFTNVFVLKTPITMYDDNYHSNVSLGGGSGYYITKGGYEEITWSKTGPNSPISFKNAAGEELAVTPGNSYICIVDSSSGKFTAE